MQHAQAWIRRTSATFDPVVAFGSTALPRPRRRRKRFVEVDREMAPLQPPHEDPRKTRRTSIRIAFEPIDMSASGQVARIGSRQ
jgi:hypothetical protein